MAFIQCDFTSDVLGLACSMNVILPQATDWQKQESGFTPEPPWPVLWLLHGLSDDHTSWMRRTAIERHVKSHNFAVVMPAVHRSYYTDGVIGHKYGTFYREELLKIARDFFPLSDKREDNFIAGLSMGGYGALKAGFLDPQNYFAAASLSGAIDVEAIIQERSVARQAEFEAIFGPLDELNGSDDDLFAVAERAVASGVELPHLYQCCGTEDFLYRGNIKYREHLKKLGVPCVYEEGPGAHTWDYWDVNIERVLNWITKLRAEAGLPRAGTPKG